MDKTPGIRFQNGSATIVVWAPRAKSVALHLVKHNSQLSLAAKKRGYWELETTQIQPGDLYKVVIDEQFFPDVASVAQPEGVHGPSQALDLAHFERTGTAWENPALDKYIIYELHTGTYSPEGTFDGIIGKLDHLEELGITAIELMPVAQFPGGRNWGYDGVFPYAVQTSYGGATGLMRLVDACHARGLAIILDVVYNHLGPEGNYFNNYGPYFTDKYKTPWGSAVNFDDAGCDGVRHYVVENALMWFRDFGVDALRLDAAHAIKDFSPVHILRELSQQVLALTKQTGRLYHLLAEVDLNDTRFIDPLDKCGYGLNAQWIDEFHHALRVSAGGETSGYYADFSGITDLAKSYRDAYVYDGVYSAQRQKTFGTKADHRPGGQFVVFSQNHDQVGNRMLGERSTELFSFEMQKLMAGAVLIAPYLPLLFMGEEFSARSPFLYFIDHSDPKLVEAVRKGRSEEFKAFKTKSEVPDPKDKNTFDRSKLPWNDYHLSTGKAMFNYYKALIALRKQLPALAIPDRGSVRVEVLADKNILLLQRGKLQQVCAVLNFSREIQAVELPAGNSWVKVIDSADPSWKGPGASATLGQIRPESVIIYKNHDI
ncbi:malto-oligosyltrehalose trehalohydrolase [Mucilaginibacter corticis]|uniref:Malto-oligosyltrehalose trehalohydrolase n=1 Tax=Mucilaginibacter corticis TaxID=2597670 RepID=A0A556MMJ4_9SPHI|nr:malto-oligosyltrehalose trehalohydrolase [Mucilaginibacter corticis]TSJ41032.1 malto-oligosyltrehalose trehalohydrolase [Mucilaginibacter corticis]